MDYTVKWRSTYVVLEFRSKPLVNFEFRRDLNNINYSYYYNIQRPHKATADEMTKFHSDDYIRFLRSIRPDNMSEYNKQMQRCKCHLSYKIDILFEFIKHRFIDEIIFFSSSFVSYA